MDLIKLSRELDQTERRDEAIYKAKELIRQAREMGNYSCKLFFEGELKAINGLYEEALAKIRNALELERHNVVYLVKAGTYCSIVNRIHEAIAFFDQAINLDPNNLKALVYKGNLLLKMGEFRRAANVYDHALKLEPSNPHVLAQRGITYLKMGNPEKALENLEHALESAPRLYVAMVHKGMALMELAREDEASVVLHDALTIEPHDPLLLTQLGTLSMKQKHYEDAITYLDGVLTLEPKNTEALCQKGIALHRLGVHDEALSTLDYTLSLDSSLKEAWKARGEILTEMGHHEDGLRCFEEALKIDTSYIESLTNKVSTLNSLGQYREALQVADSALEIDNDQMDLFIEKGLAFYGLAMYQKALEAFNVVLGRSPRHVKALFHQGLTLEKLGKYHEAEEAFRYVLQHMPEDITALQHLGYNLSMRGSHKEALEILDQALLIAPNNVEVLNLKGQSFQELENYNEAFRYFNKVLEINEEYAPALLGKGRAMAALAMKEEALPFFEAYYEKDPGNFDVLSEMGRLFTEIGRYKEALHYFEKGLEIQPKNVDLLALKVMTLEKMGDYDEAARLLYRILKNINPSDRRKGFFQFKYSYLARYRKEGAAPESEAESLHEHLINDVLNEFWKEEVELFNERIQREEKLRYFVTEKSDKSEETAIPSLYFWGDCATQLEAPCSGGYLVRIGGKGILINPTLDFWEKMYRSSYLLDDIDGIVLTRQHHFNLFVLGRFFEMLRMSREILEKKAVGDHLLDVQKQISSIIREKENAFDEIQKVFQGSYSLRSQIAYKRLDLFLSPQVYSDCAVLISQYRELTGFLTILDCSGATLSPLYQDGASLYVFPGIDSDEQGTAVLNTVISWKGHHCVFADAISQGSGTLGRLRKGENLLVLSLESLHGRYRDTSRGFMERVMEGTSGFLGLSLLAELVYPRLIVLEALSRRYEKSILRLCEVISQVIHIPCIGVYSGMELSLQNLDIRCSRCGVFSSLESLSLLGSRTPGASDDRRLFCQRCSGGET
ncbi:MAG: tetratricopeptide repeat protein [Vulcanimicrobiota bacterium]